MKPKKSSADNLLHKTILLFLQFLLPVNCFVVISTGKILQPNTTIVKSSLESTVEVVISTDKILQPNTTIFKLSLESTVEAGLESVMDAGLKSMIEAGLQTEMEVGLELTMNAHLTSTKQPLSRSRSLQPSIKSPLESTIEAGLESIKEASLATTVKGNLELLIEASTIDERSVSFSRMTIMNTVIPTMSPTETSHGKSKLSTVIGMTIYLYYTCITVEQTIFCNIQKKKEQIIQWI